MTDLAQSLPAEGPDEISARVRTKLPSLPPAEAKVARMILDRPDLVAASTVLDLKASLGVSEATVVRTSRSLGYSGYPQLRLALAAASGRRTDESVVTGTVTRTDPVKDVIIKLAGAEQQALRETAVHLDADVLEAAAEALIAAPRILCFGMAASGLVATDLQHKLTRAGRNCQSPSDSHLALTSAALMGPGDVALVVSHSGETPETLDVLDTAKATGATTISLTGSEGSPLARGADHVLIAAGHDMALRPAALSSRIGQLFVVDCLFVTLTQKTFDNTGEALRLTRNAVNNRRGNRHRG